MGTVLGYDMWMTFNHVGLVEGTYNSTIHLVAVALAGPLVTWFQGIAALVLIRRTSHVRYYPFLFLAFFMRACAMGISYISRPNDEAAASLALELPMWVLPVVFVLFLLSLTVSGSRRLGAGWKENALAFLMASLVVTLVVLSDGLLS